MADEFYKSHRPKLLKEVVGQPDAVHILKGLIDKNKVPRAILFTGPSGCGKTTLARILGDKLGCPAEIDGRPNQNFLELNASDDKGIETIRSIKQGLRFAPVGSKCKIYLLDESHGLTSPAQNSFLKILEDTPKHVYFFLATTNPAKLLETIKTRCTEIKCSSVSDEALDTLVRRVAEAEDLELSDEVVEKLIEAAEYSARKALVILHQISEIKDEDEQLTAIAQSSSSTDAIELARLLCKKGVRWPEVAKMIRKINPTKEDAERIRQMMLSYFGGILLGGGVLSAKAFLVLDIFSDNWFDCGKAGLIRCCYELVTGGKE